MQQPRYRGQHVLRYFLPWLLGWGLVGPARPSEHSQETLSGDRAVVARWDVEVGVGLRGRRETMRRTSSPPLCITLYYGYRATDGWRWKQPDGTACSWR